mgnify:CR=1 FL=1
MSVGGVLARSDGALSTVERIQSALLGVALGGVGGAVASSGMASAVALTSGRHGGLRELSHQHAVVRYQVQANRAGWIEYAMLPGIGEKTARAIVAWRSEHGPLVSVDQLEQVRGIGPLTMERVRPFLVIDEPQAEQLAAER